MPLHFSSKDFAILDFDPPNNPTSHYGAYHFGYNLALKYDMIMPSHILEILFCQILVMISSQVIDMISSQVLVMISCQVLEMIYCQVLKS